MRHKGTTRFLFRASKAGMSMIIRNLFLLLFFKIQIYAITIDINRTQAEAILPNSSSSRYSGVGNVGGCTATPVSPHLIVTAAHCVPPGATRKYFRVTYTDKPSVLIYGNVYTYPGYNRNVDPFNQLSVPDLAVIVLDSPLPSYVKVYKLCTFAGTSPSGVTVELVGYGNTGTGVTGQQNGTYSSSTKRYARNEIDRIQRNGNFFDFDFDGGVSLPPRGSKDPPYGPDSTYSAQNNVLGSKGLGPIEGCSAQGDSGGPAFYNPATSLEVLTQRLTASGGVVPTFKLTPDELFLIGVTSYGTRYNGNQKISSFGTTASYTLVPRYVSWITSFDDSLLPQTFTEAVTVNQPDNTELVPFEHLSGPPENMVPGSDIPADPMYLTDGSELRSDDDGDGLHLAYEVLVGTNPYVFDTNKPINRVEYQGSNRIKYEFQLSKNYVLNKNINLSEVIESSTDLSVWTRPTYQYSSLVDKHLIVITAFLESNSDALFLRLNPKLQ